MVQQILGKKFGLKIISFKTPFRHFSDTFQTQTVQPPERQLAPGGDNVTDHLLLYQYELRSKEYCAALGSRLTGFLW